MRVALIVLLFAFTPFFAISATGAELIDWPAESSVPWESIPVGELPVGVRPKDPEDTERPLTSVQVRRDDVDGDGVADLIVNIGRGGTGGSYVFVYRREGKRYREVLAEQGGIVISPDRKRLECWSRVGGMRYQRTVYRFDGRRFIELFSDALIHLREIE